MTKAKENTEVRKAVELDGASLSKDQVMTLIQSGTIREEFLKLTMGFNARFTVSNMPSKKMDSFKDGKEFDMPVYQLSNDSNYLQVFGSTLFNCIVMDRDVIIKTKPIEAAGGLPVYFRDEFTKEHSNLRKLSDFREADGGMTVYDEYTIIGALVTKSKVDAKRWTVSPKLYEQGHLFIEFEKGLKKNKRISWITEDRLIEISKLEKKDRTFTSSEGKVTLLGFNELQIMANADNDPRFASAQFIVVKNW